MWNQHQAMASKMVGAGSNGLLFKMLSQVGTNQILSVQPMALSTLKGVWSNVILVGCKNIETADPSSVGAWQINVNWGFKGPSITIISIRDRAKSYRFFSESLIALTCSVARMPSGFIVTNDEYVVVAPTLFLKLLFSTSIYSHCSCGFCFWNINLSNLTLMFMLS